MEQQRLKEEHLKIAAKSKNRDKMMVGKSQSTPAATATAVIPPPLNGNTDMNGNDHRMMPSISIGHGYNNDNADDDDDNESSRLDQALFGEVSNENNHDPLMMTSDRRSGKRDAKDSGSITTISHNDHHNNRTIHQSKKLQTSKSGHTEGQSKLNLNHQHQSDHGGMQVPPKNKWRDNNFDDIVNSGFYSMEALRAVGLGFSPTSIRDDERKNDRGIVGARSSNNNDYRSQPSDNDLTTTTTGLHPYDVFPPPPPPLSESMTDEDYSIAIAHRNERYDNSENNHHHPPHHTRTNSTSSMDHPITPTLDRSLEFQLKEEQLSNNLPLASSTYPIITSSVYNDHSKISNYHPSLYPHHHRHQQNNHNSLKSGKNTINSTTTTHSDNNMRKRRTMMDVISVKIIRASELMDCLGGTNAYIVLDWGKLGKASTQAVINSNDPYFGSTLKFRSPYQRIRRKDINDDDYRDGSILDMLNSRSDHHHDVDDRGDDDECLISHAGPLKVLVYNRNHSVSDELIGIGEIDVHEQLLSLYNQIINNNNNNDNYNHGSVVIHDLTDAISTLYLLDPSGNYKTTRNSVGFIEYTIALH